MTTESVVPSASAMLTDRHVPFHAVSAFHPATHTPLPSVTVDALPATLTINGVDAGQLTAVLVGALTTLPLTPLPSASTSRKVNGATVSRTTERGLGAPSGIAQCTS
jgi:hypothetical protein